LTYKIYFNLLDLRQTNKPTTNLSQHVALLLSAAASATALVGLSLTAFLAGYYGVMRLIAETIVASHFSPYLNPPDIAVAGIVGTTLALWVASCLRKTICVPGAEGRHRWLLLLTARAGVLIGITLGLELVRRSWF
jgi:hypothetical protein